jgi:hypothetical protein
MENRPSGPRVASLPFLIGFGFGVFVGVGLALVAVALVTEPNRPSDGGAVFGAPAATSTPEPSQTAVSGRYRVRATLDVRLGPGPGYGVFGLLSRGDMVDVVGRSEDADWVAILFPPGSAGRGWIPTDGVDGISNVRGLAVVFPTPLPRTVATFPPFRSLDGTATDAEPSPTAEGTPGPPAGALPDLVVTSVRLLGDGRVSVTIANRGPGELSGQQVFVSVRTLGGAGEQLMTPLVTLRPGAVLSIETSEFRIRAPTEVQAVVDSLGAIKETDKTNNVIQVDLAPPPTPTPTPTPVNGV